MSTPRSTDRQAKAAEGAQLRERATLMLDAFERAEPGVMAAQLREIVRAAKGVGNLRAILRELRGMTAGLSAATRQEFDEALRERFGPDPEHERDRELVARVRRRGHIRSEREYRVVQGYADAIAADASAEAESLALGALLDAYLAAP